MNEADKRGFEVTYIVKQDGELLGEIEDFSSESPDRLRYFGPFLSDGDIIRCFTPSGFTDTYIIRIKTTRLWPSVFSLQKVS